MRRVASAVRRIQHDRRHAWAMAATQSRPRAMKGHQRVGVAMSHAVLGLQRCHLLGVFALAKAGQQISQWLTGLP